MTLAIATDNEGEDVIDIEDGFPPVINFQYKAQSTDLSKKALLSGLYEGLGTNSDEFEESLANSVVLSTYKNESPIKSNMSFNSSKRTYQFNTQISASDMPYSQINPRTHDNLLQILVRIPY